MISVGKGEVPVLGLAVLGWLQWQELTLAELTGCSLCVVLPCKTPFPSSFPQSHFPET